MVAVLVVDDDAVIRSLYRWLLEEAGGYTVSEAEHGGPALERLRASAEPLLVLLGLSMPYVNGEQVLEAVVADTTLAARHRFIMVTSAVPWATRGRVADLRQQLGVPLVPKPFTADQLLDAVAEAAAGMS
jgi:CheY-like chemotaxis protein